MGRSRLPSPVSCLPQSPVSFLLLLLGWAAPLTAQRETVSKVVPGQAFVDLHVGDSASQEITIEGPKGARLDPGRHRIQSKSEDPEVARSDLRDGRLMVTALKAGGTKVRISVDDVNSWVFVKVAPERSQRTSSGSAPPAAPAASTAPASQAISDLELTDTLVTLLPGESARLQAHAVSANHNVVPATIRYRSVDRARVEVDSSGEVLAHLPGRTAITVDIPGTDHLALATVDVVDGELRLERDTIYLTPISLDTVRVVAPGLKGRPYRARLAWTSTNENVAQVDPESGEVKPIAPGDVQLRVRVPGRELSAVVRVYVQPSFVTPPALDSALVKVPLKGVWKSTFLAFRDSQGHDSLYPVPVDYQIEDTSVVVWDQTQRSLVGRKTGKTKAVVRTKLRGMTQQTWHWSVQVIGGSISAGPTRRGYVVGQRDTLHAFMTDARGTRGDSVSLTWKIGQPKVMRQIAPGIVEAIGAGRATLTGASEWDSTVTITALVVPDLVFTVARQTTSGSRFSSLFGMHFADRSYAEISPSATMDLEPAVSPDRTRIAFARMQGRHKDIWLMDADSANAWNITPDTLQESNPEWSPDGRLLYYKVTSARGVRVWAMDVQSEIARPVSDSGRSVQSYAVSPDGNWLLYSAIARDDQTDLVPQWIAPTPRLGDPPWPALNTKDNEIAPAFASRSGDLYFVRRDAANKHGPALMRCRPHCQVVEQVLVVPGGLLDYAVSPDGDHVVLALALEDPQTHKPTRGMYLLDPEQASGPIGQALYPINAGEAGSPAFAP